jgi:hypothetical protein
MTLDRTRINRALAKALAYKECGKDEDARTWAAELCRLLECAEVVDPSQRALYFGRALSGH